MMRKEYTCDLCDERRPPKDLTGLKFHGMHLFTLGAASSTDGTHICSMCIEQLVAELKVRTPNSGEVEVMTKDEDCCPKCDSEICICGLGSPSITKGEL